MCVYDILIKLTITKPSQAPHPSKCLPSTYCVPGAVLGTAEDKTGAMAAENYHGDDNRP